MNGHCLRGSAQVMSRDLKAAPPELIQGVDELIRLESYPNMNVLRI